jgi:hypothetical protein
MSRQRTATSSARVRPDPVVLAEERREAESAGPQIGQAHEPADRLTGNKHHSSF